MKFNCIFPITLLTANIVNTKIDDASYRAVL